MTDIQIERRPEPDSTLPVFSQAHPVLARIYAARGVQSLDLLGRSLTELLPDSGLHGLDAAVVRLVRENQRGLWAVRRHESGRRALL
jgi:single-stranded-DNA-specific exonuclease